MSVYWMISLVSLISMHSCSALNSLSRSPWLMVFISAPSQHDEMDIDLWCTCCWLPLYSSWCVHHLRAIYTALVWGNHLVPGVLAHHLPQRLVDHLMAATRIYQLLSWHHKKIIGRLIYNVGDRCQLVHNLVRDIYDGVPWGGTPAEHVTYHLYRGYKTSCGYQTVGDLRSW
jgi:hypothetical protein